MFSKSKCVLGLKGSSYRGCVKALILVGLLGIGSVYLGCTTRGSQEGAETEGFVSKSEIGRSDYFRVRGYAVDNVKPERLCMYKAEMTNGGITFSSAESITDSRSVLTSELVSAIHKDLAQGARAKLGRWWRKYQGDGVNEDAVHKALTANIKTGGDLTSGNSGEDWKEMDDVVISQLVDIIRKADSANSSQTVDCDSPTASLRVRNLFPNVGPQPKPRKR